MRTSLAPLFLLCACAQHTGQQHLTPQVFIPVVASTGNLTAVAQIRVIEAAVRFRRMILLADTTTHVDGCSVAQIVGPNYRALFNPDMRSVVSEPAAGCNSRSPDTGLPPRLVVQSIQGSADDAVATITYVGGRTFTHEEEFKVRKASGRPDGPWATLEMRVYNAMIID